MRKQTNCVVLQKIDDNGDGAISFDEWLAFVINKYKGEHDHSHLICDNCDNCNNYHSHLNWNNINTNSFNIRFAISLKQD